MSELTEKIADFAKILSDQTRLEILEFLKNGEKTSKEIQERLNKSQSTISQHLKKLYDEDLIINEEKDNVNYYTIKYQYIFNLIKNIKSFVITLQKEKIRRLSELNIEDTLT
jgi:DNA-binding transcriptional ArsR family regulator